MPRGGKRKGAGRPSQDRPSRLVVYLTPDEKRKIQEAAKASDMKVTDFVRLALYIDQMDI